MPSPSSSTISSTTTSTTTPPSANGLTNSNGKRPHTALTSTTAMANDATTPSSSEKDVPVQVHKASGYTWTREVDEPGHSYTSKKTQDEMARVWETVVHRDAMVRGRYGDPIEVAEQERQMMKAMK